jgi:hypothetical protein
MSTTFCETCRKEVTFSSETVSIKAKLKGQEYIFTGKKAICIECGNEVYAADITDENLKSLYNAYRRNK